METLKILTRISIDIPTELQQKLKTLAAINRKSMRTIVIESLEKQVASLEKKTTTITFNT
ncbi:MAG: hypothetical protein WC747_04865 [Candidatus Babeliales bacterium]|jgi:predicted DNA-binding protein